MGKRGFQAMPVAVRFWRHVEKRGPDDCWLWTGTLNKFGYGVFGFGVYGDRHSTGAHRVAKELELGRSLRGIVMHACDNPPCVNPSHLREGTHKENMQDCLAKGRHRSAKGPYDFVPRERTLSDPDIRGIRLCAELGIDAWKIAAWANCSEQHVRAVARRQRKGHVKDAGVVAEWAKPFIEAPSVVRRPPVRRRAAKPVGRKWKSLAPAPA